MPMHCLSGSPRLSSPFIGASSALTCSAGGPRPAAAGGYEQQLALGALLALVQELAARAAAPAGPAALAAGSVPVPRAAGGAAAQASASGMGLGDASGLDAALAGLDVGAVVEAARAAPDGAARNAALRLLTAVAGALPGEALHHVLEVRLEPALIRVSKGASYIR